MLGLLVNYQMEDMATYYAERSDAEDTEVVDEYGSASFTLVEASRLGYLEVVQSLIGRGSDVNRSNNDGDTPLYWASYKGHLEMVRALLAAGADVNKSNNGGMTPLSRALFSNHTQVADLLRDAGAH